MDLNVIAQLIKMVNSSSLSVLEVEDKEIRVRLENAGKTVVKSENIISVCEETTEITATTVTEEKDNENYKYIKSPIVGTFHSMETIGKGELKEGDCIKKGQPICAVEAMKLMNTIESEFDGECVEVMVSEGDMVEFGQPLIKLK